MLALNFDLSNRMIQDQQPLLQSKSILHLIVNMVLGLAATHYYHIVVPAFTPWGLLPWAECCHQPLGKWNEGRVSTRFRCERKED